MRLNKWRKLKHFSVELQISISLGFVQEKKAHPEVNDTALSSQALMKDL